MDPQNHTAKVFSLTGNDRPVEEIITKLKFLSKIENDEKINVKELFVRRDSDSLYQRAIRTVRQVGLGGESKEETLEFIKVIINEAIDLICVYNADTNDAFKRSIASMIVQNLRDSKKGLLSLMSTYSDDKRYVSNIEAVVDTMEARVNSLMGGVAPPRGALAPAGTGLPAASVVSSVDSNNVPPAGPPPPVPVASYGAFPKPAPRSRHPALGSDLEEDE